MARTSSQPWCDWEVQAAYTNYCRRYGHDALRRLTEMYEEKIPAPNLHLIMGTTQKRPWQFIVIGLLRTGVDPDQVRKQVTLF